MTGTKKIYLPKWTAWFTLVLILPIWGWITCDALYVPGGNSELGFAGWLVVSFVLLAAVVMAFLMAYRKLPAYIIEQEEQEK